MSGGPIQQKNAPEPTELFLNPIRHTVHPVVDSALQGYRNSSSTQPSGKRQHSMELPNHVQITVQVSDMAC